MPILDGYFFRCYSILFRSNGLECLTCISVELKKKPIRGLGHRKILIGWKNQQNINAVTKHSYEAQEKTKKCAFFCQMTFTAYLFSRKCIKENPKLPIGFPFHRKCRNFYKLKYEIRLLICTEGNQRWTWNLGHETFFAVHWNQTNAKNVKLYIQYKYKRITNINNNRCGGFMCATVAATHYT